MGATIVLYVSSGSGDVNSGWMIAERVSLSKAVHAGAELTPSLVTRSVFMAKQQTVVPETAFTHHVA